MLQSVTNSLVIKNNLAALELLVNVNTNQAFQFATEVYQSNTNSPEFASTEAFALYKQNQPAKGLQVIQALPEKSALTPRNRPLLCAAAGCQRPPPGGGTVSRGGEESAFAARGTTALR